jgi:hypothetical protein
METTQTAQPAETTTQETFAFVDPQTRKSLALPRQVGEVDLQKLIEGVIAKSNEDFRKKYKSEIENLNSQLSESEKMKARLDELESLTIPAKEREAKQVQAAIEKAQKEAQAKAEAATKYEQAFKSEKLSTELFKAASKHQNIRNLDQVATLFQAQCTPAVVEENGEWKVMAKFNGVELPVSEALGQWLSLEENSNLLTPQLAPGAGSTGGTRTGASASQVRRADFNAMKPAQQMDFIIQGGKVID